MQNRDFYKSVLDFITDESFQRWVREKKDLSNWDEWTLENTERAKLVEEARQWILAMRVEEESVSNQETQEALFLTWSKIRKSNSSSRITRLFQANFYRAAAAVLLIGLVTAGIYTKFSFSETNITALNQFVVQEHSNGLIEQINNTDKPQLITLSDASSILLQPKSKLSYPMNFKGNDRKVYLSGEAFFEISKDANKPFMVYANETVTKVFGTSFRIVAYSNQPRVEVLVRTGKVKVSGIQKSKSNASNEVTLYPNQAARFERKNQVFEKILDLTQDESLLQSAKSIERLNFEFQDIPVSQIFATIEQAYLVSIDFPVEKLKECYLTSSLIDEPLPEKLKIICASLGNNTRYEMNGNQIKIISNGCK
jgi:transmembrane sensor